MRLFRSFTRLPLTWRVPIAVAILMITVSAVISERVLNRFGTLQETYLQSLATSHLDGITTSISPSVLRQDSWEIFDALDRMTSEKANIIPVETIVTTESNIILAASNPAKRKTLDVLDRAFLNSFPATGVNLDEDAERGFVMRDIVHQGQPIGKIFTVFNAASLLQERREVLATLLLTNAVFTGLLVLIGFMAVRRMIQPIQVLESHMLAAAEGRPDAIAENEYSSLNHETQQVFQAFNTLLRSDAERQQLTRRLAEEDKLASLGRLASGMAHEINNPLGGLMNAVDTLRKHGEKAGVRKASLDLLQRGLQGIAEVVRATLATYRQDRFKRPLTVHDFEDIKLLVTPELHKRTQTLDLVFSNCSDFPCDCPSGSIRQVLLNLLLNASAATPDGGTIRVAVGCPKGHLALSVEDEGEGIPEVAKAILTDEKRSAPPHLSDGLGLWIIRQITDELGAALTVTEKEKGGTIISLHMKSTRGEPSEYAA